MGYMEMDLINNTDYAEIDYLVEQLIPSKDYVFIFGHGVFGKCLEKYLSSVCCKINGFIVSGEYDNDEACNSDTMILSDFIDFYKKSDKKILVLLALSSKYYGEVYPNLMFLKNDLYIVNEKYLKLAERRCGCPKNITLIVPIMDYCSKIACYGCTAAVPVAQCKTGYKIDDFMRDMKKLKELIGNNVSHINFTGGDVFLHPELINMLEYTRCLYPKALIDLSSNGVSFDIPEDDFWIRAGKVGIEITWTLYPIQYKNWGGHWKKIKKLSNGNVILNIVGDSSGESKSSWVIPYTEEKQKKQDWLFCGIHKDNKNTLMVYHNTVSVCPAPRALSHLVSKFKDNLSYEFIKKTDYKQHVLFIDKITDGSQIYEFMTQRPKLCDCCAVRKRRSMGQWKPSERKLEEWFV